MSKLKTLTRQLHWKIILIRILVNGAALVLTAMIIPDIYFVNNTFWAVLWISIGLGILNAVLKPAILLLTGQFIFVTFGLLVILVNALVLFLLERIFPNTLVVNSFLWALIGGAVLGLISNALENLLGLTPPIVPDENLELRKQIKAEQPIPLVALVAKPQAVVQHDVETQSVSEFTAARAALEILNASSALPDTQSVPEEEKSPASPSSSLPLSEPSPKEAQEHELDDQNDTQPGGAA
jgi:putative membrane protein